MSHTDHLINLIIRYQRRIMADVTALNAAVQSNTEAVNAAVTKLQETGVPTQAEVDALTTAVQASVTALNDAVAAVPA